jgi:hypothetical protein
VQGHVSRPCTHSGRVCSIAHMADMCPASMQIMASECIMLCLLVAALLLVLVHLRGVFVGYISLKCLRGSCATPPTQEEKDTRSDVGSAETR